MTFLKPQRLTAQQFEQQVQAHPNPVIALDEYNAYLVVGRREFYTPRVKAVARG